MAMANGHGKAGCTMRVRALQAAWRCGATARVVQLMIQTMDHGPAERESPYAQLNPDAAGAAVQAEVS